MTAASLRIARMVGVLAACITLMSGFEFSSSPARAASLPKVAMNAESIRPRPIEQRTGETVTQDYARAWQDLAESLATNRTELLGDYFTGKARNRLSQRISDQQKLGLRTRYLDRGHQVKAVFYSPDGGEIQLQDQAQVEMQILDGDKAICTINSTQKYLVLMTPGADRWYVRTLEEVPDNAF
jgi:hypothetical protein